VGRGRITVIRKREGLWEREVEEIRIGNHRRQWSWGVIRIGKHGMQWGWGDSIIGKHGMQWG